jgi:hypothetical protein
MMLLCAALIVAGIICYALIELKHWIDEEQE